MKKLSTAFLTYKNIAAAYNIPRTYMKRQKNPFYRFDFSLRFGQKFESDKKQFSFDFIYVSFAVGHTRCHTAARIVEPYLVSRRWDTTSFSQVWRFS